MAKGTLRAVGPDEVPPSPPKKLTILEAIDAGDRLAELEATHRRIGRAVQDEETPARDLASLTRRQMEISKEIEALRRQVKEERDDAAKLDDEAFDATAV
ncbi:hypothetical protein DEI99_005240 [Curtobacterium sp. MCLR17_036]|uniref:hypothetical protein n=1 Tax=Curtobacterium sp. MCLR17_036 TaxID=2175620 RepID=UPI001C652672|nr:hypothetical protein [Curtobacterium sp. MCLR17_036]WIE65944.1 hypothetical protein DEI99_005240 [Curtobacterium sp. MCLR17_036]